MIKSPKLYFVEPGLAAWLLGIETPAHALRDPLHGNLFENLVVIEALKARYNRARDPQLYFWRDSAQHEVDLLFESHRRLIPIEIKSAMTWNTEFLKGLRWFQKAIADADDTGHVIYAGEQAIEGANYRAHPFARTAELLTEVTGAGAQQNGGDG